MKKPQTVLGVGLLLLLLVVGGLLATTAPTGDSGPQGTLALKRFLQEMGIKVIEEGGVPSHGTLLLLHDLRSIEEAGPILSWVSKGGRLILAAPESAMAQELGIVDPQPISLSDEAVVLPSGCVSRETSGVANLEVGAQDFGLGTTPGFLECFRTNSGPFLASRSHGSGKIIILGGPSPLTNEFLSGADNARFALRLFESFGPVTFGAPMPAIQENRSPWELLPSPARSAILQLIGASLIYAIYRGRRFGRPVLEEPVSIIPSAELVRATGSLYRRARETAFAGRLLRTAFRSKMSRRFGVTPAQSQALSDLLSIRFPDDASLLRSTLEGPDPRTDEELLILSRDLQEIERRIVAS